MLWSGAPAAAATGMKEDVGHSNAHHREARCCFHQLCAHQDGLSLAQLDEHKARICGFLDDARPLLEVVLDSGRAEGHGQPACFQQP